MPDSHSRVKFSHSRRSSLATASTGAGDASPDGSISTPRDVAFVAVMPGSSSQDAEARRAIRVQAARASAQTRKDTIARRQKKAKQTTVNPFDRSFAATGGLRGLNTEFGSSADDLSSASVSPALSRRSSLAASITPQDSPIAYPVSRWHPQIHAIATYFLDHFAPLPVPSVTAAHSPRDAMRTVLWPEAMKGPALFNVLMLIAASHAVVCGALSIPSTLLAQLRNSAIEAINNGIAHAASETGVNNLGLAAIALLAAWELEYGNAELYDTHMRGLETLLNIRGGLQGVISPDSPGSRSMPRVIVDIIVSVGHDLPLFSSRRTYFGEPAVSSRLPTPTEHPFSLPDGLEALRVQELAVPELLRLVGRLATVELNDPHSPAVLDETRASLSTKDSRKDLLTMFSPLQTSFEDALNVQALAHIRLAGLALTNSLQAVYGTDSQGWMPALYEEAMLLHSDMLLLTVYEEVIFWAVFVICATTGQCRPQHMRVLKILQGSMGLDGWTPLRQLLDRYVYPATILDGRAYPLWEAIVKTGVATNSPILRSPTRYARGIPHPTRQIAAMMASAGDQG